MDIEEQEWQLFFFRIDYIKIIVAKHEWTGFPLIFVSRIGLRRMNNNDITSEPAVMSELLDNSPEKPQQQKSRKRFVGKAKRQTQQSNEEGASIEEGAVDVRGECHQARSLSTCYRS